MTRLKMVSADTTDADVAPVFQRMRKRWGTVLHLYRVLAWSPPLVKAWGAFAWSLRFEVAASRRLRELLVIHIAQQLGARYELAHHSHMAADEGISQEQIAALPRWRASDLFGADERLMLQLGDELGSGPGACAATMAQLQERFSERDIMEILVTGAYYCAVARVVNSLDLDLEPGHEHLRPRND